MSDQERKVCLGLLRLFTVDGKKFDSLVTEGQLQIFYELVFRKNKRVQILTPTQYGKSFIVALACIIISCIQKEVVAVVAPTTDKTRMIMRYYIDHLGDQEMFAQQLEKNTRLERLRMEESKDRIILRNRGGIFAISVQAGNSKKGIESAMGSGSKVIVMDEACLIPDAIEATVFRMIAGKGPDAFYCKIGNPFYRNHFFKSSHDPNYKQIKIDYKQALLEGRVTAEFIDEARLKPYFSVLFECLFPDADNIDQSGYSLLLSQSILDSRIKDKVELFGTLYLGCDVAGEGSNFSVVVLRGRNGARVIYRENNKDTMNFAGVIARLAIDYKVKKIYVDAVGIGKPVYDRLREFPELSGVIAVISGTKPEDEINYFNKRAEMFWRLHDWLPLAELEEKVKGEWADLLEIRYKIQSDRKIKIKSKDEMLREGVQSPDVADALALTFYDRETLFGKPVDTETKLFKEMIKRRLKGESKERKHLFL
jgi:hypothetical protein